MGKIARLRVSVRLPGGAGFHLNHSVTVLQSKLVRPLTELKCCRRYIEGVPERLSGSPMSEQPHPAPILVVEDEVDLRALIGYNLSRSGYPVELTADLGSARQVLECGPPSLVILDLMLPDGSGLELARQIRQSPSSTSIPILFVTARPKESCSRSYRFSAQDDYLPKPFSVRELLARVQAQMKLHGSGAQQKESIP